MIGAVSGSTGSPYATSATQSTRVASEPMQTQTASAESDVAVELSPGAKLLSDLPPFMLDPKVHMANAEKRLSELMQLMGIPPNTDIDISVSSNGSITVEGDNEKLADLQQMLNDGTEMDLRNSLIGAHVGATIQRIAAATQSTQAEVEANPQATEALWNRMLAQANNIKNQGMNFSWSGGSLSAAFTDGTAIAVA